MRNVPHALNEAGLTEGPGEIVHFLDVQREPEALVDMARDNTLVFVSAANRYARFLMSSPDGVQLDPAQVLSFSGVEPLRDNPLAATAELVARAGLRFAEYGIKGYLPWYPGVNEQARRSYQNVARDTLNEALRLDGEFSVAGLRHSIAYLRTLWEVSQVSTVGLLGAAAQRPDIIKRIVRVYDEDDNLIPRIADVPTPGGVIDIRRRGGGHDELERDPYHVAHEVAEQIRAQEVA